MVRGIEKKDIFADDEDRYFLIRALAELLPQEEASCYAWALMQNHFHLLLRSSKSLAGLMRRLLTRYALRFNKRHDRCGHLFQNRYKSIVVDEDAYFCTVVCYIHSNPLRAGYVHSLRDLSSYRYCGHSVLLGLRRQPWQDTDYVLGAFGGRDRYLAKMGESSDVDLEGGGLLRLLRLEGMDPESISERELYDERVLGKGDFVERVRNSEGHRQSDSM